MRRRVIAGNWKMYKTQGEARAFIAALAPLVGPANHCDIVVAPPFTALAAAVEAARGTSIAVSAPDLLWDKECSFTGEISTRMSAYAGLRCVYKCNSDCRHANSDI